MGRGKMGNETLVHVEVVSGIGVRQEYPCRTCTGALYDLREIREQIDPEWIPLQSVAIWVGGERAVMWTYQDNDEDVNPRLRNLLSMSLIMGWERLKRACQRHIASRLARDYLLYIHQDAESGGVLLEENLREEGLLPCATKTRPGYWPRGEKPLVECLEYYEGVYGVGLVEHIPRYDTPNYHYVKYWLYDLEEVKPL